MSCDQMVSHTHGGYITLGIFICDCGGIVLIPSVCVCVCHYTSLLFPSAFTESIVAWSCRACMAVSLACAVAMPSRSRIADLLNMSESAILNQHICLHTPRSTPHPSPPPTPHPHPHPTPPTTHHTFAHTIIPYILIWWVDVRHISTVYDIICMYV